VAEEFARCAILRTAQWALDGRKVIPSAGLFRSALVSNVHEMLDGMEALTKAMPGLNPASQCIVKAPAAGLGAVETIRLAGAPKLILTSPPYPGVHVLYHRWQVLGRREAPAPYWITNQLDGAGSKHYTLGDRRESDLASYFANLELAFRS